MKAAVVFDLQQGPVWADFTDPQADAHHPGKSECRRHQPCGERSRLR